MARGSIASDELGDTLIVADGNFARDHRLSRRDVRHVVDGYVRAASVKRPQVSNHPLRHTSATLAYRYTHDLRAVQDMLGHQDPKTTGYARVVDRTVVPRSLTLWPALSTTMASRCTPWRRAGGLRNPSRSSHVMCNAAVAYAYVETVTALAA